jgi:hypothetical protein
MASVTAYEFAYLDLTKSFLKALELAMVDDQSSKALRAMDAAFAKAKKYGWDWENDEQWGRWANKATGPEIAAHGLATAIMKCRLS